MTKTDELRQLLERMEGITGNTLLGAGIRTLADTLHDLLVLLVEEAEDEC